MVYNNFICPCCGLPNHLEFENRECYNNFINYSVSVPSAVSGEYTYELINRNNYAAKAQDLYNRFETIKAISSYIEEETYQDWFAANVVCFIREGDSND